MLSPIEIMKIEYEKSSSGISMIPISCKREEIRKPSQKFINNSSLSDMPKNTGMSSAINAYSKMLTKNKEYSKKR